VFVRKWVGENLLARTASETIVVCLHSGSFASATFVKWINHHQKKGMMLLSPYAFRDKGFHPSRFTDLAEAEKNRDVSENMERHASHDEEKLSPYLTDH
jgi:hypothetical protein